MEENELGAIEEEERQSNKDSASNAVVTHFKNYETKILSAKKIEDNREAKPNDDKALVSSNKKMIVLVLILLSIIVALGVMKSSSKKSRKKLK